MATYRHAKGPSALQIIIIVLVCLVALALVVGAAATLLNFSPNNNPLVETTPATQPPTAVTEPATEAATEPETEPPTEDPDAKYTDFAKSQLNDMSKDEKIYQMLLVTPEALTGVDVATVAGDTTKECITDYPIGGIFYSADNFEDKEQAKELIEKSQSFSKIPMFIGVCEEGGENSPIANTLKDSDKFKDTIYEKEDSAEVKTYCSTIATNLTKLGINLNLAPSANIDDENAFSGEAKAVSDLTSSAVKGFADKGIAPTLKFFPTSEDTDKSSDDLTEDELQPFAQCINDGAGIVIVGNVNISGVDGENPAFMSKKVITDMLVKDMKFDGVVMTPDLSDTDITDEYSTEEIVTATINAGANLLLCPDDVEGYAKAIKKAIKDGDLTIEQIDDSVTKILSLKYKYGIIPEPATPTPSEITTEETEGLSLPPIDATQ